MKPSQSFYVAYPADSKLRDLINTLKIIADDSQRTEAHITVRGPYKKKLSNKELEKFSNIVSGQILTISQVDNFFPYDQNTVFYKIDDNDKLRMVWKKMTYNDFKPHLTIYDGENKEYAIKLFNTLRNNFKPFKYEIEKLTWLEPKGELPFFHLKVKFNYNLLNQILNKSYSKNDIHNLTFKERLNIISEVTDYLYSNNKLLPTKYKNNKG